MLQNQVIYPENSSDHDVGRSEAHALIADIAHKVMAESDFIDVEKVGSTYYVDSVFSANTFKHTFEGNAVWGLWHGHMLKDTRLIAAFNTRLTGWIVPFSSQLFGLGYFERMLHVDAPELETNARRFEVLLDGSELNESYLRIHHNLPSAPKDTEGLTKTIGFWAGCGLGDSYLATVILYINLYAKYVMDLAVFEDGKDKSFKPVHICVLLPKDEEMAKVVIDDLAKPSHILAKDNVRILIVTTMQEYLDNVDYHMSLSGRDAFICDPVATFLSHPMRPGYKVVATPRYDLVGRKYIETNLGLMLESWVVGGVSLHKGLVDRFNDLNKLIVDAIYYTPEQEA